MSARVISLFAAANAWFIVATVLAATGHAWSGLTSLVAGFGATYGMWRAA